MCLILAHKYTRSSCDETRADFEREFKLGCHTNRYKLVRVQRRRGKIVITGLYRQDVEYRPGKWEVASYGPLIDNVYSAKNYGFHCLRHRDVADTFCKQYRNDAVGVYRVNVEVRGFRAYGFSGIGAGLFAESDTWDKLKLPKDEAERIIKAFRRKVGNDRA